MKLMSIPSEVLFTIEYTNAQGEDHFIVLMTICKSGSLRHRAT